jgi:CubicO group peptidase (beta-lactamase class C family)
MKSLAVVVALAALAGPGFAQESLSPAQRARIDSVFSAFNSNTPGCALGVYRNGAIAYSRGYGMANLEHNIPITAATLFDIGSTSKQFTATSILLLAQDDKLSLDDEVRKWIPGLPDYGAPVTIRQLLHHTSGIRDYLTLMSLRFTSFDGVTTDRDALDLIVRQKELNFRPGSEYLYSNSGYFLLSEIVKRASGQSLRVFATQRIFAPLGMTASHFHNDHTMIVPLRATAYAPRGTGYAVSMSGFEQTGDGAVHTSIDELLAWDNNFYTPKVGGQKLLDELHVRGVLNKGDTITYARGLMLGEQRGLRTVSHGGSWAGYRAELLRFPAQHTSIAVLCNVANGNPSGRARRVADVLFESQMTALPADAENRAALPQPPPRAPANLDRAEYSGDFYSPELDIVYRIRAKDGALYLERLGNTALPLNWRAPDEFGASGFVLNFRRAGGRVSGFTIGAGRVRNIAFEKRGK